MKARRGEYIGRNQITVTAYLDDWIDSHSMEIKPRTLLDYRACIRLPRSVTHLPELLSPSYRNRVRNLSPRNRNQDVHDQPESHTQ